MLPQRQFFGLKSGSTNASNFTSQLERPARSSALMQRSSTNSNISLLNVPTPASVGSMTEIVAADGANTSSFVSRGTNEYALLLGQQTIANVHVSEISPSRKVLSISSPNGTSKQFELNHGASVDQVMASLGVAGSLMTLVMINQTMRTTSSKGEQTQGDVGCETPDGTIGFKHDMKCSFGDKKLIDIALMDNSIAKINFRIDLDDYEHCCREHDKKIYCAKTHAERIALDASLTACLLESYYKSVSYDLPWYLEWLLLDIILVALLPLLGMLIWWTLIAVGYFVDEEYYNFDGRHNGICLCGGDLPTLICDANPTDCNSYVCGKEKLFTPCCRALGGGIHRKQEGKRCCEEKEENGQKVLMHTIKDCPCDRCCWRRSDESGEWERWSPTGSFRNCCPGTPGPRGTVPPHNPKSPPAHICWQV